MQAATAIDIVRHYKLFSVIARVQYFYILQDISAAISHFRIYNTSVCVTYQRDATQYKYVHAMYRAPYSFL